MPVEQGAWFESIILCTRFIILPEFQILWLILENKSFWNVVLPPFIENKLDWNGIKWMGPGKDGL